MNSQSTIRGIPGPPEGRPIIIGHRGAAGYRLENTLGSFEHAIDLGADLIEPDIVCTKDHVLIVRHENALAVVNVDGVSTGTTDVASRSEFTSRRTTKTVDGLRITGWFTEDFTLAEIKTLRCVEQYPQLRPSNVEYDGRELIPSLNEVIDLVRNKSASLGRRIGICAETKHAGYFTRLGLRYEELFLDQIPHGASEESESAFIVESFESAHLKRLSARSRLPLVQLIGAKEERYDPESSSDTRTFSDMLTQDGMAEIADYAAGIAIDKDALIPLEGDRSPKDAAAFVHMAHEAGLIALAWTFRNENYFLPSTLRRGDPESDPLYLRRHGNAEAEYALFYNLGIDGVFSDHPDTAVSSRSK